jgi:hypothetical protein
MIKSSKQVLDKFTGRYIIMNIGSNPQGGAPCPGRGNADEFKEIRSMPFIAPTTYRSTS